MTYTSHTETEINVLVNHLKKSNATLIHRGAAMIEDLKKERKMLQDHLKEKDDLLKDYDEILNNRLNSHIAMAIDTVGKTISKIIDGIQSVVDSADESETTPDLKTAISCLDIVKSIISPEKETKHGQH